MEIPTNEGPDWLGGSWYGWRHQLTKIIGVVHIIVFCALLRWLWPEATTYAYVLVTLTAVMVTLVEIQVIERLTGHYTPLFEIRTTGGKLLWGGMVLAFALALGLFIVEQRDTRSPEQMRKDHDAWREEMYRHSRNATTLPSAEDIQRLRELRNRASTRPAKPRPAGQ